MFRICPVYVDEIQLRTYGTIAIAGILSIAPPSASPCWGPCTTHGLVRQAVSWRLASVHMSVIASPPGAASVRRAPSASQ